ncbi:MAG: hypothetical protein AB7I59_22510 [Geminicoccaceae bacterium]
MKKGSVGAILGASLLAGCVTDGGGFGNGGSDIRWSGPVSQDPFTRSPYGFGPDPFGGWGRPSGSGSRTFRPRPGVVCDRATETCYRGRDIDASETRDVFGRSAAREVDRIRDEAGTNRIYRVSNKVVCDRRSKTCYKNGHPDNSETKDFFGRNLPR